MYEYNLPDMFWIKDIQDIQKFTLDDINEVAKKYFNTDEFILLIVTDTTKVSLKDLKI